MLLAHAARMPPASRRSWGAAMEREAQFIESDLEALGWALGGVFASYIERVKAMSLRQRANLVAAAAPTIMSLLALSVVLIVVTTGWERRLKDEGAAAHIFQLLIVGQLPFMAAFLITTSWRRSLTIVRPMLFQVAALALALGSVAYFKL